jgi:hypothetical protein
LSSVYQHFSAKKGNTLGGRLEETITLDELLEMFRRAKLIENQQADPACQFSVKDIICAVERYYDPKDTLASKISDDKFQAYLDANPDLLKVNQEPEAKSVKEEEESKSKADGAEEGEAEREEVNEEALAEQLEAEKAALRESWEKDIVAEHLLYVKGVEIVYYEFKELLLDLSNILAKQTNTYIAGKPRSTLKKFLEENFLKRLSPYIRFCTNVAATDDKKTAAGATRSWPESEKDKKIRMVVEERKKKEAEEQARLEELAQQHQGEALPEEVVEDQGPTEEELKAIAEEEARKAAQEKEVKDDEEDIDEDEKSFEGDYYDEEDESNA